MKKSLSLTENITRAFFALAFFAVSGFLITGCSSSSSSPGTTSTVSATNDMQNTTMSAKFDKAPSPTDGPTVDALTITKVRVVMANFHLHVSDAAADGVGTFLTKPTVITFTPGATNTIGSTTIPIGIYTQMIFDTHPVNAVSDPVNDGAIVAANPDFATGSSIIIDGTITKNGSVSNFQYKTAMNRNLKPVFTPSSLITVAEQSYSTNLRFDGKIAFLITSGKPLDPTDPVNASAIDDQIAKAFLAQH